MSEWQSMETAPKDGRKFLVWASYKPMQIPSVSEADLHGIFMARFLERTGDNDEETIALAHLGPRLVIDIGLVWRPAKATHWMPLPEPPK